MSEPWFQPKRNGYGAGLPIHWKGWAVLAAYLAGMAASSLLLPIQWPMGILMWAGAVIPLTITFVQVARHRTRGGWRARWGGHD